MIRKIRLGNDIDINWAIVISDDTRPYILEGKDLKLELICGTKVIEITEFDVNENVIHFMFYGKDQKYEGLYVLKLTINEGEESMVTFDTNNSFMLVEHSWAAKNNHADVEKMALEFLELSSAINIDVGVKGDPGESAYEIAVDHGFVGTEEEWLASLQGEPGPAGPVGPRGPAGSDAQVTKQNIELALGYSPVNPSDLSTVATTGEYRDILHTPAIPTALSELTSDISHRTVTDIEKAAWNAKYDKPDTGIPKTDLASDVQTSLGKADTALQEHQDISGKADKSEMSVSTSGDKTTITLKEGTSAEVLNSHQDISGKAEKSEMAVTTSSDKTTITLKSGLSAEVLNQHQDLTPITELIPAQATSSNPLADKAFVNSSISTATATFQGTYNSVSDLSLTTSATHAQIATALASEISSPDSNDYCFVQIPTSDSTPTEIASVERYKFNGTAWDFEFELNNSGYTAAQWAAINSGITSAHVTKLNALPTASELSNDLDTKVDKISGKGLSTNDYDNTEKTKASNGETAYGWGNHANAGYAAASDLSVLTTRVGTLEDDEGVIDEAIRSFQSQIDSLSSKNTFDELIASSFFSGIISGSNAYFETIYGDLVGNSETASYLISSSHNVGSALNPVYFSSGRPVASSSTAGSAAIPVWVDGGTFTPIDSSSLFSSIISTVSKNLSVTIAGLERDIAALYSSYDGDGEEIALNMSTIGSSLQSLQSQIDSISSLYDMLINKMHDLEMRIEMLESV